MFSDKNNDGFIQPFDKGCSDGIAVLPDDGTLSYSEILQESHYYPFGMKMDGPWQNVTSNPENKYGFGSKELNDDFGLDWLDYGARWYDPAIGRWANVDPLAEAMASWSPYNYGFDSPVTFSDPSGLAPSTSLWGTDVAGEKSGERGGRMGEMSRASTLLDVLQNAESAINDQNNNFKAEADNVVTHSNSSNKTTENGSKLDDFINEVESNGVRGETILSIELSHTLEMETISTSRNSRTKERLKRKIATWPDPLKSSMESFIDENWNKVSFGKFEGVLEGYTYILATLVEKSQEEYGILYSSDIKVVVNSRQTACIHGVNNCVQRHKGKDVNFDVGFVSKKKTKRKKRT